MGEPPDDPCDPSFEAMIVDPADGSTMSSNLILHAAFGAFVPDRYVIVRDEHDNRFTTASDISGQIIDAVYPLPAGRTITAELGYVCATDGKRHALATSTFTIMATDPCDEATLGYSATITGHTQDEVLPPGVTDSDAFGDVWMPAVGIFDRYAEMYDETAGHTGLVAFPGYDLQPGHRFTYELGWTCNAADPDARRIPLAALSFTTSQ